MNSSNSLTRLFLSGLHSVGTNVRPLSRTDNSFSVSKDVLLLTTNGVSFDVL